MTDRYRLPAALGGGEVMGRVSGVNGYIVVTMRINGDLVSVSLPRALLTPVVASALPPEPEERNTLVRVGGTLLVRMDSRTIYRWLSVATLPGPGLNWRPGGRGNYSWEQVCQLGGIPTRLVAVPTAEALTDWLESMDPFEFNDRQTAEALLAWLRSSTEDQP
jgi:hypothetical protein